VANAAIDWDLRSLGLAENPIYLTSDLLFVAFPIIGVLLTRAVNERTARCLAVVLLTFSIALLFTETRSWVTSAAPAVAAMAFALRGRAGKELVILLLIAALGFWYWADLAGSRYALGPESDSSAATRPVLWNAAFNIALDHPILGIGHGEAFQELSPEYAGTIDPALLARQNAGDALGQFAPHNDFLTVWVSFGTVALLFYLLLLGYLWNNFWSASRRLRDPMLRGIALGGLGALVAYVANSLFHNLLDSTLTLWLLAGLSVGMVRFADQQEEAP
jgi:O-antigen ligase